MDIKMCIDIHTHHPKADKSSVYNVVLGQDKIPSNGFYSVGIHPWFSRAGNKLLEQLKQELNQSNKQLLFIGECGLDKLKGVSFPKQQNLFLQQVLLSEEYEKPLLIHCVKSYNELIRIKKEISPKQQWIVHGFNRKVSVAEMLLAENMYLSLGLRFLKTQQGVSVLKRIPLSKLFFETDDDSFSSIEEVYILASEILQVSKTKLKQQIGKNLCRVIGWKELNF